MKIVALSLLLGISVNCVAFAESVTLNKMLELKAMGDRAADTAKAAAGVLQARDAWRRYGSWCEGYINKGMNVEISLEAIHQEQCCGYTYQQVKHGRYAMCLAAVLDPIPDTGRRTFGRIAGEFFGAIVDSERSVFMEACEISPTGNLAQCMDWGRRYTE